MTNSLALLAQPHDVALRTIIQEALKPGVSVDNLYAGVSEVQPNGQVHVPVYIDSDAYSDPSWPYRGSVEMTINRVDLQAALGHLGLAFRIPDENYSTTFIVNKISSILQLHFDPSDYIHESRVINTASEMVVLKAADDSPRWSGQVSVFVHR